MSDNGDHPDEARASDLWRGLDLSGTTLVLGVGTGRMIGLLCEQVALSGGQLLVLAPRSQALEPVAELAAYPHLARLVARGRDLPVRAGSIDLLVLNGALREVPTGRLEQQMEELWRALVPGGKLRVSDILEPGEADYDRAWAQRNAIIRRMAESLGRPTALAADLRRAAMALRAVGFDELHVTLLPGFGLSDVWLEETVTAISTMASRLADRAVRERVLGEGLPALVAAYRAGGQRATERFVLAGRKPGDLHLDMEASFTEQDLTPPD